MNGGVQQTGLVTPGHVAVFNSNGVIQDGGPSIAGQKVLTTFFSANFNATYDQALLLPPYITAFQLASIIVTNPSSALAYAQGGFYTQAGKQGSTIVAASQAYSTLTSPNLLLTATLTTFAQTARFSSANLGYLLNANNQNSLAFYLSLTTAEGIPVTADVYAIGIDLSPP